MIALWLEIAKIEMDIADSPDKQIRNPSAWVLQVFKFIRGHFEPQKRYNMSVCQCFVRMAYRLGLLFLGGEV